MKHIFREVVLFVAVSGLVFVFALACGTPFVVNAETPNAAMADSQQSHSSVFQGTVLRNGERFSLRTTSGTIYLLDDPEHVQHYEGKSVRITGTLDSNAKLIHVARIEAA